MPLNKQPISINFSQGVQTKIDKWQLPVGQFSRLTNSVFTKAGMLEKRNGFGLLTGAPIGAKTLATLNGGLVSLGSTCESYSKDSNTFTDCGMFQSMDVRTAPMARSGTSQITCDIAVDDTGLACSVWLDSRGNSYYQVSDSDTGQIIVPAVQLVATATMPRVYIFANKFIVTYIATISTTPTLQYVAVPVNDPNNPAAAVDVSTQVDSLSAAYDGQVVENRLYFAWNGSDVGGEIRVTFLTETLLQPVLTIVAGQEASLISITADLSNSTPNIWVSYFDTDTVYGMCFDQNLLEALAPTAISTGLSDGVNELVSVADLNLLTVIYENQNTYDFAPNAKSDYISKNTLTISGTAGTASVVLRGVGIASRAITSTNLEKTVFLATYGQAYQPTYFLIDLDGNVLGKLASSNGAGYMINQILPNIYEIDDTLQVGYLYAAQIAAVNKTQGDTGNISGVYAQLGINLAVFTIGTQTSTLEIGGSLHASGGMMWQYDGVKARELGFHVWPEDIGYSSVNSIGNLTAQTYFYQVTYEWTDAAGQIHRSAPSVPLEVELTASEDTITLQIPTLRQTYKTDNKVRIVVYRWSTGQQVYYQASNMIDSTGANPLTFNDPSVDSITFIDTLADSAILGNNIIYTAGGVLENIAPPAAAAMALFGSRFWIINAENPNELWYSKQVIQNTPVEMSDFLALYVAPTTGAQGSTGASKAISSMDDKLIIFKKDAIYYINGQGPDSTGANGSYSDAVFITSTVGCDNPKSIVLTPDGIMFQSDKGIWLLGRDLSTSYIGAPVEDFTDVEVTSALTIPATNQIRFTLEGTKAIMYDYYYKQWGNWDNVPAISSTLFEGMHTYINKYGQIVQETPGSYLDLSRPVLLSFTTSWFNLAGLQGFQRFYQLQLLGKYLTPHKLHIGIAYDYTDSNTQTIIIQPLNYAPPYGAAPYYGSDIYGGVSNVEEWRVFPEVQKCTSFQLTINEYYDISLEAPAGAGLTLSGLNILAGIKKGSRPNSAATSVG